MSDLPEICNSANEICNFWNGYCIILKKLQNNYNKYVLFAWFNTQAIYLEFILFDLTHESFECISRGFNGARFTKPANI